MLTDIHRIWVFRQITDILYTDWYTQNTDFVYVQEVLENCDTDWCTQNTDTYWHTQDMGIPTDYWHSIYWLIYTEYRLCICTGGIRELWHWLICTEYWHWLIYTGYRYLHRILTLYILTDIHTECLCTGGIREFGHWLMYSEYGHLLTYTGYWYSHRILTL